MTAGADNGAGVVAEAGDLGTAGPVAPLDDVARDDKALALREKGKSFASIARALGMGRGLDANAAFNRSLRRHPAEEQEALRNHEIARLDALGEQVRKRGDLDEVELARKMRSLDRLRKSLFSA